MLRLHLATLLLLACAAPGSADELPERIRVATWNLEWFFDSYTSDNASDLPRQQSPPNRGEWEWRLAVTASAVAKLDATILCFQEVESRSTVFKLVKKLRDDHRLDYRVAFVEGGDVFTEQDVCVLARSGLVEYGRKEQSQEMFDSKEYYNLTKHLFCTFEWGAGDDTVRLTLLNIHARAQDDQSSIRKRQAKLAHRWLAGKIAAGEHVILAGDTNTAVPVEEAKPDTDIGVLRGLHTPATSDDLFDCHELLKRQDRPTHINGKAYDRLLVSEGLRRDAPGRKNLVLKSVTNRKDVCIRGREQDKDHWNIYYEIPQGERDISDHFPIVAEFAVE